MAMFSDNFSLAAVRASAAAKVGLQAHAQALPVADEAQSHAVAVQLIDFLVERVDEQAHQ